MMETQPFNDEDYSDVQLVALLAMKGQYAEGRDQLTHREIQGLKFTKWLIEHGQLDEFTPQSTDAA